MTEDRTITVTVRDIVSHRRNSAASVPAYVIRTVPEVGRQGQYILASATAVGPADPNFGVISIVDWSAPTDKLNGERVELTISGRYVIGVRLIPRVYTLTAANGVPFTARYLRTGDAYGRTGAFTANAPMVEFYDARFIRPDSDSPLFTEHGQFVSSYYASTLNGHEAGVGLDLQGDVPDWELDGRTFDRFAAWFHQFGR